MIDASWFGVIGDNSATVITEQTEKFNKHTVWDDEIAIELYDLANKENAEWVTYHSAYTAFGWYKKLDWGSLVGWLFLLYFMHKKRAQLRCSAL